MRTKALGVLEKIGSMGVPDHTERITKYWKNTLSEMIQILVVISSTSVRYDECYVSV